MTPAQQRLAAVLDWCGRRLSVHPLVPTAAVAFAVLAIVVDLPGLVGGLLIVTLVVIAAAGIRITPDTRTDDTTGEQKP